MRVLTILNLWSRARLIYVTTVSAMASSSKHDHGQLEVNEEYARKEAAYKSQLKEKEH